MEGVPGQPVDEARCRAMVQALLAGRFKLAIHHETRPMPVYAMTVAKNGPKLQSAGEADAGRNNRAKSCASPPKGWSMQELAGCMDLYLYPMLVVDHTGLTGTYAIGLDFAAPLPDGKLLGDGPDVFSAVESQLGLKLDQREEPVEMIVVDHIQPPDAN